MLYWLRSSLSICHLQLKCVCFSGNISLKDMRFVVLLVASEMDGSRMRERMLMLCFG